MHPVDEGREEREGGREQGDVEGLADGVRGVGDGGEDVGEPGEAGADDDGADPVDVVGKVGERGGGERRVDAGWEHPYGEGKDGAVHDGGGVEGPAPADCVGEDAAENESQTEAEWLSATHGREGNVTARSMGKGAGYNADGAGEAEGGSNTGQATEYNHLGGVG